MGKSTLLNSILGEKVAIVSNKPQTTRNRITGIFTRGEEQFVFLDTPGMHSPKNSLGEYMVKEADSSMREADAVVLVVDTGKEISSVEENVMAYLKKSGIPSVLALNKIDQYDREDIAKAITRYSEKHDFSAFMSEGSDVTDTVRDVHFLTVDKKEDIIEIRIGADGYLYNMVRIIAGTLIEVGNGAMEPDRIPEILAAADRSAAGPTAPACGLTMMGVEYM